MIEEPKLLTIAREMQRPTAAQIGAFQNVPTGFVVDAMFGSGQLDMSIRHLPGMENARVAGPALTVDTGPADILGLLAALKFIKSGDIVVSAFGGHQGCAAAGDRVSAFMKNSGAAGFVTDGPMRDHEGLMEVGLPSWCTGLNPGSPFKTGPARVGLPVELGGRQIGTGDMIVADRDGVVVVPFARLEEVLEMLPKVAEAENALDAELSKGLSIPDGIAEMIDGDDVDWV